MKLAAATRFMHACKRGANAAEMDTLLIELRRDERLVRDAEAVARIAGEIANGTAIPTEDSDEVAALLARARYLMETA